MSVTTDAPTAAASAPPAPSEGRCPTDFRYWEALERPEIQRRRRLATKLLRFDPCPSDDAARAVCEDLYAGDPVAADFVDEVFFGDLGPRKGRNMLEQALREGVDSVDAPPTMRTLFAEFEEVPEWVDPALVEEGAAIWRRWGRTLFNVAGAGTLEMYTEAAVALPLSLTGGYAGDNALRRFLETSRFWMDVSEPGALLRPGSEGRATAMRVRVMHVSVRRRVDDHPEWDPDRYGLPISQTYMLLTLIGGSVAPALIMWGLGYQTSPHEMRALLHYQRYLGHLLGVRPRWYPDGIREAVQLLVMTGLSRSHTAGPAGAELIESFPEAFAPRSRRGTVRWLREAYEYRLMCAYTAALMAPWTRRRFDLPPAFPWVLLLGARLPLVAGTELARRVIPGVSRLHERAAVRQREAWYRTQMDGREAAFDASSALRR